MSHQPPASTTRPTPPSTGTGSSSFEGPVATLAADIDENAGLRPGYKLKLNSYDLGVDIELNDAINRIRFEHPEVRTVVVTSAKDKVFCSGANIFMLGVSQPRLEGELLQVHQRDAQRPRRLLEAQRPEVPGRGQRRLRRRRLRAGAGLRRDHPGRRPLAAPSACPRCRCSACCPAPAA